MLNVGQTLCTIGADQKIEKIEWNTPFGPCSATLSEDGVTYTFKARQAWGAETNVEGLTLAECTLGYCVFSGMVPPHKSQPFQINW